MQNDTIIRHGKWLIIILLAAFSILAIFNRTKNNSDSIKRVIYYDSYSLFKNTSVSYRGGCVVIIPKDTLKNCTFVDPPHFPHFKYKVRTDLKYGDKPLLPNEVAIKLAKEFESLNVSRIHVDSLENVELDFYFDNIRVSMKKNAKHSNVWRINSSHFHSPKWTIELSD